jgi:hypothetical protein
LLFHRFSFFVDLISLLYDILKGNKEQQSSPQEKYMNYEDYFYDPWESSPNGFIHEDDLPDLDFAKKMIKSVINAMYETGDIESLEDCLEELASCFQLKIPNKKPLLTTGR